MMLEALGVAADDDDAAGESKGAGVAELTRTPSSPLPTLPVGLPWIREIAGAVMSTAPVASSRTEAVAHVLAALEWVRANRSTATDALATLQKAITSLETL